MTLIDDRVLALAGLLQALAQVRRTADTGQSDPAVVQTALDSVFRIDAATVPEVYGGVANLSSGLRLLRTQLAGQQADALGKLALAVLQLERKLDKNQDAGQALHDGLLKIVPQAEEKGSTHPDVVKALGALYADTLSHVHRVMVQGTPHYLAQPAVVAEIRAILLAATRSAVLWRQMGGGWLDLLLNRRRMIEAIDRALRQ